jgi:uncharacterized protein (TIGR00369 family)
MIDVAATFAATPANRLLGLRLVSRTPQRVEIEMPMRADFAQEGGVVHGGLLALLADTTAVYLLWPELQPDRTMTSIEFKVNFLAAGRPDGSALRAVATVLRLGRSVAVCESEVFQADVRLCKGTFTYLLRDQPRRAP